MKCSRAFSAEGLFADRLAFWGLAREGRLGFIVLLDGILVHPLAHDSAASAQHPDEDQIVGVA